MDTEKNHKLAKALLAFKLCYKDLVDASKDTPDFDISEAYPFYLLDFEEISPAVEQWCTVNATKLLKTVPATVESPLAAVQQLEDNIIEKELDAVAAIMNGKTYVNYGKFEDDVAALVESNCPATFKAAKRTTIGIFTVWGYIRNYIRSHAEIYFMDEEAK